MADVIEVIHKISYEVNDAALQNVSTVITAQIKELNRLNTALYQYQQELNNTKSIKAFDDLSKKIDSTIRQIEVSGNKAKGILSEIAKDIAKDLSVELLSTSVTAYASKFKNGLNEIGKKSTEISPLLDSLGNAIVKPAKGGGQTALALNAVGTALGGFSTLIPVAIGLLAALGGELLESGGIFDGLKGKVKDTLTETDKIVQSFTNLKERSAELASGELVNVQVLYETATNVNQTYDTRIAAVKKLQELYPKYFGNLTQEAILAGKAADQYKKLTDALIQQASIKVYKEELEALAKRKREIEQKEDIIDFGKKFKEGINKTLPSEANGAQRFDIYEDNPEIHRLHNEKSYIEKQQKEIAQKIQELIQLLGENTIKTSSSSTSHSQPRTNPKPLPKDELAQIQQSQLRPFDTSLDPSSIKPVPVQVPEYKWQVPSKKEMRQERWKEFKEKVGKSVFGDTNDIEDPEERRREQIKKSVDAYQSLVSTAVQAYQTITEAQIKALDKEIEIRKDRVAAATKLAERGNTEALRIEEERLAAAEKKRALYAKRQAVINSALAVSNAIVAVAEAAAQSGVGAIVTVPAVIAAIVAGYAAITAATQESGSFKDGVVDFKGKGTATSDSNVVRISHGESVITAAGTAANRDILEAINRGAVFNMLQPQIKPQYLPAAQGTQGYASRTELKGLEKKMDKLIDTVAANGTTVHASMDERGLSLMTVKQIRKEHNRFR